MSLVRQIITELRQTVQGAAILDDWLGSGGEPVPLHQAELRAGICLNCPKNVAPNWWARFFKDPVAMAIRKHLALKNQIGLRLAREEKLHMCETCGCANRLKPWVPIEHIRAHHKPEHNYPELCWVKKELET